MALTTTPVLAPGTRGLRRHWTVSEPVALFAGGTVSLSWCRCCWRACRDRGRLGCGDCVGWVCAQGTFEGGLLVVCPEAAKVRKCALNTGLFKGVGRPPLSAETGVGGIAQVLHVFITKPFESSNIESRHHLQAVSIGYVFLISPTYHVIFVNQIVAVEHIDTCPRTIECQNFDGFSWLKKHNVF